MNDRRFSSLIAAEGRFSRLFIHILSRRFRACLHGGGVPQVGEVTRLGGVTRLYI